MLQKRHVSHNASRHPVVLMLYFLSVAFLTMFTLNPVFLCASLLCALFWFGLLHGAAALFKNLACYFVVFALIALTNPLFSHNGETALFSFNGREVTLEAIVYGCAAGALIISIIFWFKCYSEVMTSDKFIYLFGKTAPKLALVISMALRFAPLFKRQIIKIGKTHKTLGLYSSKSLADKITGGMRVFSALVTWALENAIETADSMKARGYGLKGRTSFSLFKFTRRDAWALGFIAINTSVAGAGVVLGKADFHYYPRVATLDGSPFSIAAYAALGALMLAPFIPEFKESLKWTLLRSKI